MSFYNEEEELLVALQVSEIMAAEAAAKANKPAEADKPASENNNNSSQKPAAKEGNSTPPASWEIIDTPGTGHLCGFYAVIRSLGAQMPDLPAPTVQDLTDAYNGSEMAALNAASGLTNSKNFGVDQVAGTLYEWGQLQGANLQLGCLVEGAAALVLSTRTSDADNVRVLWIHNDNASALHKTEFNHFSGLRLG